MKNVFILLVTLILVGCGPSAEQISATAEMAQAQTQTAKPTSTPTQIPTITPTSTPSYTPTPELSEVYESELLGVSVRYPAGWEVSENDIEITFEDSDKKIAIIFFPADVQSQYDGNPVTALTSFIQFLGIAIPDKESLHLISLNDSEYAYGVYSSPGEALGFNNPNPLFTAMHFTDEFTIYSEMDSLAGNEDADRQLFEMVLTSLPPSIPLNLVATPTLEPKVSTDLPLLPEGITWQGVETIDFALPIPDGWYVTFTRNYESYQGDLKEYDYQYLITQENPDRVGSFSAYIGIMSVWTFKTDTEDVGTAASEFVSNLENNPAVTIIDKQFSEQGNIVSYQYHINGINSEADIDDPNYNRTSRLVILANKNTNTFYLLNFESASEAWDQESETGTVMMDALVELLNGQPK